MDAAAQAVWLGNVFYFGAIGLVLLGAFAVVAMGNLIRILLGLGLLEAGVNLFMVAVGYRPDAVAPILSGAAPAGTPMVDPIPQALILTAIVIGVGVLALSLALVIRVYRAYGTLDTRVLAQHLATGGEIPEGGGAVVAVSGPPVQAPERGAQA